MLVNFKKASILWSELEPSFLSLYEQRLQISNDIFLKPLMLGDKDVLTNCGELVDLLALLKHNK